MFTRPYRIDVADGWGAAAPLPGIVTPEAVVLEMRLATLGSRVLAILLDLSIQLSALFLLLLGLAGVTAATSASLPTWIGVVIVTFLVFFVIFGYPAILETIWNGKTVGKRVLGIRVVTTSRRADPLPACGDPRRARARRLLHPARRSGRVRLGAADP